MEKFSIIRRGRVGEFSTVLENKLRNFQEDSDYYTYQENSGYSRKKHYVICSERLAEELKKVDWGSLEGFKEIEVEEQVGSSSRTTDEKMKFVIERVVNEWLDYYELTKPGAYVKRYFRDLGISIENRSSNSSKDKLRTEFEEGKKDKDLSKGVYRSSWEFDKDGLKDKKETYQPAQTSFGGKKTSENNVSGAKKHCSNCGGKEFFTSAKFCENCGQRLVEANSSQIREITYQEAREMGEPTTPFFSTKGGKLLAFAGGLLIITTVILIIKKLRGKK